MAGDERLEILEQARRELNRCKREWSRLARLSKRQLSYRWITGFANGEIKDPSFSKIDLLCRYIGMKIVVKPGPHFAKFEPDA